MQAKFQLWRNWGDNVKLINIGIISAQTFKEFLEKNSLETSSNSKGEVKYVSS